MKKTYLPDRDSYVNANIYMEGKNTQKPYEYNTKKQYNAGAAPELRTDGTFLIPVMGFNLRELRGKKILSARLVIHWIHNPVEEWDIGTISHPWVEGTGTGINSEKIDGISLWNYDKNKRWPENGTFNEFILGNQNSRHQVVKPVNKNGNRQELELLPELLYSLIYNENFGLAFVDTRADVFTHCRGWNYFSAPKWLHSRQSPDKKRVPYLEIEFADYDKKEKPVISGLACSGHQGMSFENRGLRISWKCRNGGEFTRFDIKLNGRKVKRYLIPVYDGRLNEYTSTLYNLKPSEEYDVEVGTYGPGGSGERVCVKAVTPPPRKAPRIKKKNPVINSSPEVVSQKDLSVYALDEFHKIEPRKGRMRDIGNKWTSRYINTVVKKGTISIKSGLNEVPGFQLIFHSTGKAKYSVVPFGEKIPDIRFYREWYVYDENVRAYFPDALIPATPCSFNIPEADNSVPGQKFQGIYAEVLLDEVSPVRYEFDLGIHKNGELLKMVPVVIDVSDFRLEERGSFIFELNSYNYPSSSIGKKRHPRSAAGPGDNEIDYEFYKMAHDHRTDLDVLPYSHFGNIVEDSIPELKGSGADTRVADWKRYDEKIGPVLDGTVFKEGHRKSGLRQIYLPFYENWPIPIKKYYKPKVNPDQPFLDLLKEHKKKSWNIKDDFDPEYREGIKNVLKDFIWHFEDKGWTDTKVFFFFNNKYYSRNPESYPNDYRNATSWWLLDEPFYYDDWRALKFFAEILQEAKDETKLGKNFMFRLDVSWQAQYHHLDGGLLDVNITNSAIGVRNTAWYRKRAMLFDEEFWNYGSTCDINSPNTAVYGNIMRLYSCGGQGFLPWKGLSDNSAFNESDRSANMYHGQRFGVKGPVSSLRLKAIRRLMQDLQYVSQTARKFNLDRFGEEKIIRSLISMKTETEMTSALDAGWAVTNTGVHEPAVLRESLRPFLEE
ncbi:MAG: hypothetical protein ACLFQK_05290 [Fibrobacterota bacterium]